MRRSAHVFAFVLLVTGLAVSRPNVVHADALPSITIGSASVIEGDSGSAVVNIPVDLSAVPTVKTTVQYWIHGGTASGLDFVGVANLLTFAAGGPVSKFISVTVNGDLEPEPDETVLVDLVRVTNATLANSQGIVTILDDDSDTNVGLQANIGDFSVYSAASGVHYAALPVTLSRPAPSQVKVYYSITCTAADEGVDYVFQSTGTLTFSAGQQTKQLQFQILPNETEDQVKTILESIRVSSGPADENDSSGEATIVDGQGGGSSGGSGELPPLPVGSLERESVNSQGDPAKSPDPSVCDNSGVGSFGPTISADGRYVAFNSDAVNLVPNDNDGESDVFVRDRVTGAVERVSVASDGSEQPAWRSGAPYAATWAPAISRDGRYVTFHSDNGLGGYPGNEYYIHDRQTGTTVPLMYDLNGHPVDIEHGFTQMLMSSDNRYIAFTACGDNSISGNSPLVPTDADPPHDPTAGAACDVFRLDRTTGVFTLVSNPPDGSPSDGSSEAMSPNGRFVAFMSTNPNYVPGDTNGCLDWFVRDMDTGTFERIDVTSSGQQALRDSTGTCPSAMGENGISLNDDGRYVAFTSDAWNLIGLPDGTGGPYFGIHVFVRDRVAGTTTMVGPSGMLPSISSDGAYVGYYCEDCYADNAFVVTEVATGDIVRVSELPNGIQGDGGDSWWSGSTQALSADGAYYAFATTASNLAAADDNNVMDIFVKRIH